MEIILGLSIGFMITGVAVLLANYLWPLEDVEDLVSDKYRPPKIIPVHVCPLHKIDMYQLDEGEHVVIYKCPNCKNVFVLDKGCSAFCSCRKLKGS